MVENDSDGSYRDENPYSIPRVACGKCGTEHHIDATTLKYQGHCRKCYGFLRRPTEDELQQFTEFYVWNCEQRDRELRTDTE